MQSDQGTRPDQVGQSFDLSTWSFMPEVYPAIRRRVLRTPLNTMEHGVM